MVWFRLRPMAAADCVRLREEMSSGEDGVVPKEGRGGEDSVVTRLSEPDEGVLEEAPESSEGPD